MAVNSAMEEDSGSASRCRLAKTYYDNILLGRLWRTVKYEEVYLHAYSDGWEAKVPIRSALRPNPVPPVRS